MIYKNTQAVLQIKVIRAVSPMGLLERYIFIVARYNAGGDLVMRILVSY
jgi:hypothetical protein